MPPKTDLTQANLSGFCISCDFQDGSWLAILSTRG
jgi:hypothetical protein